MEYWFSWRKPVSPLNVFMICLYTCSYGSYIGCGMGNRMVAQQMQSGKYAGGFRVYGHDKVLQVLDWICRMTLPKKNCTVFGKWH